LKSLPVPDRFHSELSIDFITDLLAKKEENLRFLMVITNRLLKSCTLKAITFIKAEDCAKIFV
jgi:predicted CopG family antitoxin